MLVALVIPTWSEQDKNIIINKRKALAKAQRQTLASFTKIKDLQPGEALWLYSHGGAGTFAEMSPEELAGWLIDTVNMPKGKRLIVLKGCQTGTYAKSAQEILNDEEGYEQVVVAGFEGEASRTTNKGEMQVRTKTQEKKADQAGALAAMKATREAREKKLSKDEERVLASQAQSQARRQTLYQSAVLDDGSNTFVAADDRMARRLLRNEEREEKQPAQQPATTGEGSDSEGFSMEEDVQTDETMHEETATSMEFTDQ